MAKRNAPKLKSLISYLLSHAPETLIVSGLVLVVLSFTHNFLRLRSLRIDQDTVAAYNVSTPAPTRLLPTHINIPWYVDVAIDPAVYQDQTWTVSPDHASFLLNSAAPGEGGNIIIYGHNTRTIMGNIRALKGYEKITLTLADGTTRTYQVESLREVSPTDTRLLQPTDTEVLTLYTCSGILDSRRFVVRATLLVDPPAAP